MFKKIRVLSGGERARVALAKTILAKANFLLLDEPTNHLDIASVNVLVDVLNRYEGSYVVVSHDRYFLSRIANKIWHIENYQLKEYPGTYEEFDIFQEQRKQQAKADLKASQNKNAAPKVEKKIVVDTIDKTKQAEQKKEKQKLEQQVKKLEEQLNKLKQQHDSLSEKMSDPEIFKDAVAFKKLQVTYASSEQDVKKAETEWEAAYEKLLALD